LIPSKGTNVSSISSSRPKRVKGNQYRLPKAATGAKSNSANQKLTMYSLHYFCCFQFVLARFLDKAQSQASWGRKMEESGDKVNKNLA